MTKSTLISALFIAILVGWVFNRFVARPLMPWWVGLVSTVLLVVATFLVIKIVSALSEDDSEGS
jgi:F0F1-type ATP synthase assembly protein I